MDLELAQRSYPQNDMVRFPETDQLLKPCKIFRVAFTWNSPIIDEQPGPPLNHVANGAVLGLFLDSKNQNHMLSFAISYSETLWWDAD
jgi:hypothetical protein